MVPGCPNLTTSQSNTGTRELFSMSAESSGSRDFTYWRLRFRAWRGNRPFWAGLFTMVGGLPIAYFPYANMHLGNMTLAMSTTAGAGSLIIGVLLVTLGLTMWFHGIVRVFAGIAAILLALISLPVANIGGFVIGFLLSMIGGALSLSWAPAGPQGDPALPAQGGSADGTPYGAAPGVAAPAGEFAFDREAVVPEQQTVEPDKNTTVDANGGRHRAG